MYNFTITNTRPASDAMVSRFNQMGGSILKTALDVLATQQPIALLEFSNEMITVEVESSSVEDDLQLVQDAVRSGLMSFMDQLSKQIDDEFPIAIWTLMPGRTRPTNEAEFENAVMLTRATETDLHIATLMGSELFSKPKVQLVEVLDAESAGASHFTWDVLADMTRESHAARIEYDIVEAD